MMPSSKTSKQRDRSGQFIFEVRKPKKRRIDPDMPKQATHIRQDRKPIEEDAKVASVFRSWAMPDEAD